MNLIIISRCQSSVLPPTLIFQSSFVRSSVLCCRATPSIPPSSSLSPPLTQPHVILGQPPVSHPKPVIVHSNDGKRWFPNRHLEKKLAPTESRALTTTIDIEAKTFRISQKNTIHGIALQISKQRPSLPHNTTASGYPRLAGKNLDGFH